MNNHRALFTAARRLLLLAVFAPGLAAAQTPAAPAKAPPASPSSGAPSQPDTVEGVTVDAARPHAPVPADKAADYAAEAAKTEEWRKYRESTPPLTKDPNDMSKDFPGLKTYVPPAQ
jgi:hypothetical protein